MIDIIREDKNYILADLQVNEANLSNADQFKAELIELIDAHNKKILLSLHQVNYVDSSFLGALVSALKHAIAHKTDIALVGLRKDVRDLLALIRLDKVFKIYESFNEAVSA